MIVNFSAQNFGSIRDKQTLSFEADNSTHLEDHFIIQGPNNMRLLKLGLIYGANASGKSTILKALQFLRDLVLNPVQKKTDELDFEPFLFDPNTPSQNTVLEIEFISNKVKYLYEVEFNKKAIVREHLNFFAPNKAKVFSRTTDRDTQYSKINFGSKFNTDKAFEKTLESNTLWNNTVLGGYLKTNIDFSELKYVVDWFNYYLGPLIETKTNLQSFILDSIEKSKIDKEDVIKILKQADFNISDIVWNDDKRMTEKAESLFKTLKASDEIIENLKANPFKKVNFQHTVDGFTYTLSHALESEGTQRYFEFAGLLCILIKESKATLIDELESSLHPDLYVHFLLSFIMNSKRSQLLATTHNREILSNRDIFRHDVIWFTDKSEQPYTKLYSLADFDSTVVRDTTNVLNAYKSGKLRGTPNLGDYYIELAE
jgi:AAA15 family ATPase/GTPase